VINDFNISLDLQQSSTNLGILERASDVASRCHKRASFVFSYTFLGGAKVRLKETEKI